MKTFILIFSLLSFNPADVWARNLLPYIQMPVKSEFFLSFSSQGLQFKECPNCTSISLKPSAKVTFFEHHNPIELQQATELFISKKHRYILVFYNRQTSVYDRVVFGRFIEDKE